LEEEDGAAGDGRAGFFFPGSGCAVVVMRAAVSRGLMKKEGRPIMQAHFNA
jgi:hypothetical protein